MSKSHDNINKVAHFDRYTEVRIHSAFSDWTSAHLQQYEFCPNNEYVTFQLVKRVTNWPTSFGWYCPSGCHVLHDIRSGIYCSEGKTEGHYCSAGYNIGQYYRKLIWRWNGKTLLCVSYDDWIHSGTIDHMERQTNSRTIGSDDWKCS